MHDEDKGLAHDLEQMLHHRRQVLQWISAAVVVLPACSDDKDDSSGGTVGDDSSTGDDSAVADDSGLNDDSAVTDDSAMTDDSAVTDDSGVETCTQVPEETAGPFPGDGTNGPDALELSGIVRSDIRANLSPAKGIAEGVALTLTIEVVSADGCAPLEGRAVYVWQCDRESKYSMYTKPDANYLRGVQPTDAKGRATFTTIFPGCYPGRWPHVHFEIYPSLKSITDAKKVAITSQLAFPEKSCAEVYAQAGYEASATNLENVSLATDGSFGDDNAVHQMVTVTGNVKKGYQATLKIAV
jgi:protocatechuate 3,4-dioxygenase beta subunit